MIPQSAIHIDGGRAWVLCEPDGGLNDRRTFEINDRPCATCGGSRVKPQNHPIAALCPDCDGTGRHTFELEVSTPEGRGFGEFIDTLRVHVVPGMVLPIVEKDIRGEPPERYIYVLNDGRAWLVEGDTETPITLPPDAAPGMWAIQLRNADR